MLRVTPRTAGALALFAMLGLSACTAIGPAYGGYPTYPASTGYPDGGYDRPGDYRSTVEWRTLDRDAARYAREVDRAVGLRGRQSREVEQLVRDRARRLLQQTPPRTHRAVYPFPRNERNATARRWWDDTDRAIERTLNSRQRDLYRRFTRGGYGSGGYNGGHHNDGYYNDGRSNDGRYDDRDDRNDYPGIRYDDRDDGRDGDGDRGRIGTGNGRDGGRSVREEAVPREGRRPAPRPDARTPPRNDTRGTDRDGDRGPADRGTAPRDARRPGGNDRGTDARRTPDESRTDSDDEAAEDRDGDRTVRPPARPRPARRNG